MKQVSTDWGIKEQSLYGIEGWSLFRGCFTTRVCVAAIRTEVSGRYKVAGCSSGVVVKRGSTVNISDMNVSYSNCELCMGCFRGFQPPNPPTLNPPLGGLDTLAIYCTVSTIGEL